MGNDVRRYLGIPLVALQLKLKVALGMKYPNWSTDVEQYKGFVKEMVVALKPVLNAYNVDVLKLLTRIDECTDVFQVIRICHEVFRKTGGLIDLCP